MQPARSDGWAQTRTRSSWKRNLQQSKQVDRLHAELRLGRPQPLCGFFRDQRTRTLPGEQFRDLHLLPVIAEFPAAIEAHHVRPRADSGRTPSVRAHRDWKTVAGVPAAEHRVHHPGKHRIPSLPRNNRQDFTGNSLACFSELDSLCAEKVRTGTRDSSIRGIRGRLPQKLRPYMLLENVGKETPKEECRKEEKEVGMPPTRKTSALTRSSHLLGPGFLLRGA